MQNLDRPTADFFKLKEPFTNMDEKDFLARLDGKPQICEDISYTSNKLRNPYPAGRYRVKNITFRNISFKSTVITGFEFTNCKFERCLFVSTIFIDCRFTACIFVESNPHRVEFKECFVDPKSFHLCISDWRFSNIGIYLFHELLRNSRQQAQPDFSDEAQYQSKRWRCNQLRQEALNAQCNSDRLFAFLNYIRLIIFDITCGFGFRLGRFSISALLVLFAFSIINWQFAAPMGLMSEKQPLGILEAVYFSTVVTTTLGFGDISPTTSIGRMVVSLEAITGFVLFALLTSTLYRKFSS